MSGPTVTVTLDAEAVAGMLSVSQGLTETLTDHGLHDMADRIRAARLAMIGALRAAGWTPDPDNPEAWVMRSHGRRTRR